MVSAFFATLKTALVAALALIGVEFHVPSSLQGQDCKGQASRICTPDHKQASMKTYDDFNHFVLNKNSVLLCNLKPATYRIMVLPLYVKPDELDS